MLYLDHWQLSYYILRGGISPWLLLRHLSLNHVDKIFKTHSLILILILSLSSRSPSRWPEVLVIIHTELTRVKSTARAKVHWHVHHIVIIKHRGEVEWSKVFIKGILARVLLLVLTITAAKKVSKEIIVTEEVPHEVTTTHEGIISPPGSLLLLLILLLLLSSLLV